MEEWRRQQRKAEDRRLADAAYDKGYRDALRSLAWQHDGIAWVGNGSQTLEFATSERKMDEQYRPPFV